MNQFQSTHSLRSATRRIMQEQKEQYVSIHALLAECDTITGFFLKRLRSFNPRTPCGVRLKADEKESILWAVFQSTHSLRSATDCPSFERCIDAVSIHALLAECDLRTKGNYYVITKVSIHALLAECDLYSSPSRTSFSVSIHALLAECDRTTTNLDWLFTGFNPRTPCGVRP